MNDATKTPDGKEISIGDLQIGDEVLAIDHNDQIIPTEVIAILHYENNSQGKAEESQKKEYNGVNIYLFFSSPFLYFHN